MQDTEKEMEISELARLLLEDPRTVRDWTPTPEEFKAVLQHCLAEVDSNPEQGEALAQAILRPAPDRCLTTQAWGLVAQGQRAQGKAPRALVTIHQVHQVLGDLCTKCDADLDRREAYILRDLRLFSRALSVANDAIAKYRGLEGPGHDLHGNGLASTYVARATIYDESGHPEKAVEDASRALSLICPKTSPKLYRVAIFNLATYLYETGERSDLELADEYVSKARKLFKGVQKPSQERAKLGWLTCMIRYRLGKTRPARLLKILRRCQRDFITVNMPQETLAVAADSARIAYPNLAEMRDAIIGLQEDLNSFRMNIPKELRPTAARFKGIVTSQTWIPQDDLQTIIKDLRNACGPKMLPCLVTW